MRSHCFRIFNQTVNQQQMANVKFCLAVTWYHWKAGCLTVSKTNKTLYWVIAGSIYSKLHHKICSLDASSAISPSAAASDPPLWTSPNNSALFKVWKILCCLFLFIINIQSNIPFRCASFGPAFESLQLRFKQRPTFPEIRGSIEKQLTIAVVFISIFISRSQQQI